MRTEDAGRALRPFRAEAHLLQGLLAQQQRRGEGLALDDGHAALHQFIVMRDVARARQNRQCGQAQAHGVDQRQAVVHIVDGDHQRLRLLDAGRHQQVHARGVAIKHLEAELAQQLDLIRVVVEHRHADLVGRQQAADDLAETAKAGDDDGVVLRLDMVVGTALLVALQARRDELVVRQQQQGRGHHRQGHHHDQQRGRLRRKHVRGLGGGKHDEGEFAALRQQQREEQLLAARNVKEFRQQVQQGDFDHQQAGHQDQDQQGLGAQHAEVDGHADGDEEQTQQQALERLQVGNELMAVFGIGQQHARHEGAQRHRQAHRLHQHANGDHQQQGKRREDFAQVRLGDEAQDGVDEEAPADHQRRQHGGQLGHAQPARFAAMRDQPAQERHQRDHGNGGDILEQQDGKAGGTGRRTHQFSFAQGGQHDGRRRQRQPQCAHQRRAPVHAKGHGQGAQPRADDTHLRPAPAENRTAQQPQAFGLELQADQKQQQHHAEFGKAEDHLDILDQAQAPRPDDDAGHQVAQHGAHAQALGQRHHDDGRHQVKQYVDEKAVVFHADSGKT